MHRGIRLGKITILSNGDETCVSTEPCPKSTLSIKGGKCRVIVRVRGTLKSNITVYLAYCVKLSIGPDAEGDPSVILGDILRCKPVLLHKGKRGGKIDNDLHCLRRRGAFSKVAHTVTPKGKTDEASMLFIIQATFCPDIGKDEKCLYTVDGAPSHMHPSISAALQKRGAPLYISPPSCTQMREHRLLMIACALHVPQHISHVA